MQKVEQILCFDYSKHFLLMNALYRWCQNQTLVKNKSWFVFVCVSSTRLLLHMMVNLFSWTQDAITHTTVMELLIDENWK